MRARLIHLTKDRNILVLPLPLHKKLPAGAAVVVTYGRTWAVLPNGTVLATDAARVGRLLWSTGMCVLSVSDITALAALGVIKLDEVLAAKREALIVDYADRELNELQTAWKTVVESGYRGTVPSKQKLEQLAHAAAVKEADAAIAREAAVIKDRKAKAAARKMDAQKKSPR